MALLLTVRLAATNGGRLSRPTLGLASRPSPVTLRHLTSLRQLRSRWLLTRESPVSVTVGITCPSPAVLVPCSSRRLRPWAHNFSLPVTAAFGQ